MNRSELSYKYRSYGFEFNLELIRENECVEPESDSGVIRSGLGRSPDLPSNMALACL